MEEVRQDAAETAEEEGSEENSSRQDRAWFPYITKVQFERFLSRLETKIPDQIDRDYVRPIIRTPSMIHRFLRGIESMNLTDRDQKPTELLLRIVPKETRKFALAEVVRDLYKDLLPEWEQNNGNMSDDAIVDYFRSRTGMGRDSANKMKMFFKYLTRRSRFRRPLRPARGSGRRTRTPKNPNPQDETPEPAPKKEARSAREPAPKERSGRDGRTKRTSSDRQERQERQERSERSDRSERSERSDRQERPLTETQRAYLETLQSMVQIKIDGDWDEDMIRPRLRPPRAALRPLAARLIQNRVRAYEAIVGANDKTSYEQLPHCDYRPRRHGRAPCGGRTVRGKLRTSRRRRKSTPNEQRHGESALASKRSTTTTRRCSMSNSPTSSSSQPKHPCTTSRRLLRPSAASTCSAKSRLP